MAEDKMISCPDCGLVIWTSKWRMHKQGECFVKTIYDLHEAGKK